LEYPVFTVADIMNIESDAGVRYGLVKRAMRDGDLVQIKRGLYTLAVGLRKKPINLHGLSNRMYYPSYVSLVSALSFNGWIPEKVVALTCVTSRNNAEFDTPLGRFTFARIPQKLFFCGVELTGDGSDTWLQARPLKALADYVYIHKFDWTTREPPVESLRIEDKQLESISSDDFDNIQGNYHTAANVEAFLAGLRKDLQV